MEPSRPELSLRLRRAVDVVSRQGSEATETLEIRCLRGPVGATLELPGSKSLTNRALAIGALAEGASRILGALDSDDTRTMVDSLGRLGFEVEWNRSARSIRVVGRAGEIPARSADLYGGNAGTTVRFLTSLVALGHGRFRVDGDPRMRERPIRDLLEGLRSLGVEAKSELDNGCPPVVVEARGLRGGTAVVPGDTSSQFVSSILIAAPYAREEVRIRVTGEIVGAPYVEMTLGMMRRFGVDAARAGADIRVPPGQRYRAREIAIEPDATAASHFLAAPLLLGGEVTVRGLDRTSFQGDVGFVDVLEEMGATVVVGERGITVRGAGTLRGIDRDFRSISDTFLTAAVLAPFASTPSRIRGIGHTRHQETDRVAAVARELSRLGVRVKEEPDALEIHPSEVRGGTVETYQDHRMAMSFALIGLRVAGIRIRNPSCVGKTFPDYFATLALLEGR